MNKVAAVLTALFVLLVAQAASAGTNRLFAVIVGNNESDDPERPSLRYADDDAVGYAQLFSQLGAQTHLLTELDGATRQLHPELAPDGAATRAALEAALASVNDAIQAAHRDGDRATLYFVYAGHGDLRHGEGYITLADGPLSRSDFHELVLDGSQADTNHIIIDACKSYFLVFERGADEERIPYDRPFDDARVLRRSNTGFFLSTSAAYNSHEWEALQAGVFSHEVRSGLRGAADLDQDGRVSYTELAAFIYGANRSIPNEKYRPDFLAIPPVGDDTLAEIGSVAGQWVSLDTAQLHHFFAEDADGVRVVDTRPGGQVTRLFLPEHTKLFLRDVDANLEYVLPSEGDVLLSGLTPQDPSTALRGAAHEAFRKLFQTPFDQEVVAAMLDAGRIVSRDRLTLSTGDPPAVYSPSAWLWAGLGVSAALAASGVGLRLQGDATFERFKTASDVEQPGLQKRTKRIDNLAMTAWIASGVAAALSVGIEVWFATSDD